MSLALGASLLYRAYLVQGLIEGYDIDDSALIDADNAVLASQVGFYAIWFAAGVCFIIWQYKHTQNGRVLGRVTGLGPIWSIFGWLIPFASIFLPAYQLLDTSRQSRWHAERKQLPVAKVLVITWACFYNVSSYLSSLAGIAEPAVEDPGYPSWVLRSDLLTAAAELLTIVAGILAIIMLRTLTAAQESAFAAVAYNASQTPAAQAQYAQTQYPQAQHAQIQYPQNQQQHAQYPQNQYPQNQYPQNQYPLNQYPHNQHPQSQSPPAPNSNH